MALSLLYIPITTKLPVASYPWLIIAGVWPCSVFLADCFQFAALNLTWWYSKFTFIPKEFHSIIPLLLVIPVGLWDPYILGGSHDFIKYVTNIMFQRIWQAMVAILLVYFILRFWWHNDCVWCCTISRWYFHAHLIRFRNRCWRIDWNDLIDMGIIPASCHATLLYFLMLERQKDYHLQQFY